MTIQFSLSCGEIKKQGSNAVMEVTGNDWEGEAGTFAVVTWIEPGFEWWKSWECGGTPTPRGVL